MVVLAVDAQMLGEVIDAVREHSDLHFGGTGIRRVRFVLIDQFLLALCC
jgi:hypothetical protein